MQQSVYRALVSKRRVVREAARRALLRPQSGAVAEVCRSALAEGESLPTHFIEWCTHVAPESVLVDMLHEVELSRGSPAERSLVQQVARFVDPKAVEWARTALNQADLSVGLRGPCHAILLRSGAAVEIDFAAELEAAAPFHRGVQSLVAAAVDGNAHLPAVHACIAHPVHGTEVLHTLQRCLFGGGVSVSELAGCLDVTALKERVDVDGMDPVWAAGAALFAAVQSGETDAWGPLALLLVEHLPLPPVEGKPSLRAWAQAHAVRELLSMGLPAAQPAAFASIMVSASACLAQRTTAVASRNVGPLLSPPEGLGTASQGASCAVEAARVSGGPDAISVLIEALDSSQVERTDAILHALARLAWRHPRDVAASVKPLLHLIEGDPSEHLLSGVTRVLSLLSPSVVHAVIAACPVQGDRTPSLASVIGTIGGPAARDFLLAHADTALQADHGVLAGLCALGDPAAIERLSELEPRDPTGEIARALVILSELSGLSPSGLGSWRARMGAVEQDRLRRQSEFGSKLMAAALGQRFRPERRSSASSQQTRKTRRPKRKKGKRRR